MAVLGTAVVTDVYADDPSHFKCEIRYTGHDGTYAVEGTVVLEDVSPTITAASLESAIKSQVKATLEGTHGFTFGVLDTVRLIGALL